jgi:hypothetical protein
MLCYRFVAYSSDRISQFIRKSPRLRTLVPWVRWAYRIDAVGYGDLGIVWVWVLKEAMPWLIGTSHSRTPQRSRDLTMWGSI